VENTIAYLAGLKTWRESSAILSYFWCDLDPSGNVDCQKARIYMLEIIFSALKE